MTTQIQNELILDGSITTAKFDPSATCPNATSATNATNATNVTGTGTVGTTQLAASSVTPAKMSQPLTQGTAVATTTGTFVDFTGIPSWAKRITVMFNGVSTSGANTPMLQLGSGSPTTTGYNGIASGGASTLGSVSFTNGFQLYGQAWAATCVFSGHAVFTNVSGNIWAFSSYIGSSGNVCFGVGGGTVTLAGVLDRVRLTTTTGVDTFDAGSINILYE